MWNPFSSLGNELLSLFSKERKSEENPIKAWTVEHDKDGISYTTFIKDRNDCPGWAKSVFDKTFGKDDD